jgi:hypothetical protein
LLVIRRAATLPRLLRTLWSDALFVDRRTIDVSRVLAMLDAANAATRRPPMIAIVPHGHAETLHAIDAWSSIRVP